MFQNKEKMDYFMNFDDDDSQVEQSYANELEMKASDDEDFKHE